MFTVPADWKPARSPPRRPPRRPRKRPLTAEEKKTLLRIARDTLEAFVRTGRTPEIAADASALTPALKAECGAFVTLNRKNGDLRGCIGNIGYAEPPLRRGLMPLYTDRRAHDGRGVLARTRASSRSAPAS